MYFNRPIRGLRPSGFDWMQDEVDPLSNSGYGAAPSKQGIGQPDFSAYPTWAHGVMAQVYPRLDQAGRLPEPLILDSAEIEAPTEVYKQVHPLCRKPDSMSAACEKEWKSAEAYCAAQAMVDAFRKRGGARTHIGRGIHECVCGQVSQSCGGNPHVKTPFDPPPKKKGYFGS